VASAPHGWAAAAGDFNGDGFADLAVGAPGETVGAAADAGAVEVYAGVNTAPIPDSGRLLFQNAPGVPGTSEAGEHLRGRPGRLLRGARVLTRPAA